MEKEEFSHKVRQVASQETSLDPDNWKESNPLWGHCVVVSLIAQDIYGGELLRGNLLNTPFEGMKSHYWNRVDAGEEVDFTEEQFQGNKPELIGEERTREYLLTNEDTLNRYQLIKDKFEQIEK
jgi:hypothetical protein